MEYEMISEKELDRLLEKEQGFVIDLRSPWEYAAYHIPGAVNIPYERLKKVRGLPKNVPLIFYCERGSVRESDRRHPFLAQKAWIEAKKIDREKQQDYS